MAPVELLERARMSPRVTKELRVGHTGNLHKRLPGRVDLLIEVLVGGEPGATSGPVPPPSAASGTPPIWTGSSRWGLEARPDLPGDLSVIASNC